MNERSARSADELGKRIEGIVAAYIAEGRNSAAAAVERAFVGSAPSTKQRHARKAATSTPATSRRPVEEMEAVAGRLLQLVRRHPGESLAVFAAELDVPRSSLNRPMEHLREQGLVHKVGERRASRYFPRVAPQIEK
jgi:hypothetical protein